MTGLNSWLKGSQTTAKSFFIPQLLPKSSHRVSTTYLKDLNLLTCKISEKKSNALKSHILVITQFQRTCSQSGKWENRAWGPRRVRTKEDRGRWDWGIRRRLCSFQHFPSDEPGPVGGASSLDLDKLTHISAPSLQYFGFRIILHPPLHCILISKWK